MTDFKEELKRIPLGFENENSTFKVKGKKSKTFTVVLDKNHSKEYNWIFDIYIGGKKKEQEDALLYLYSGGPTGSRFLDYLEKDQPIGFENAESIVHSICERFKLNLNFIPITYLECSRKNFTGVKNEKVKKSYFR